MTEQSLDAVLARAVELAYLAFETPDDEHVLCIYHRLILDEQWGGGGQGATTVH